MQEIITVNNQQYSIESTQPLTNEQRSEVIKQLSEQTKTSSGCSSCEQTANNKITTLATGCPTTAIPVGTVKTFRVDSATGVSPFIFTPIIGGVRKTSSPSTPTSSLPYSFPAYTFDTAGSFSVAIEVVDACGSGALKGSDSCPSNVVVEVRRLSSMLKPTCASYAITVGSTTQATVGAGTDQFGASFTPTNVVWSSSNTSVATVTTTGGVVEVNGVVAGTATITATSGTIISPASDVITVSAVCTTPTCSFSIV